MDGEEWALSTKQVLLLADDLKLSTLQYWVKSDLVEPTVRGSVGQRYERLWTIQETVVVRMIKTLRDGGCPLQRIRAAKTHLESAWGRTLRESVLVWNGDDLFVTGPWGEVRSVWKRPGQLAFKAVAMPVGLWRLEAEKQAHQVTVSEDGKTVLVRSRP